MNIIKQLKRMTKHSSDAEFTIKDGNLFIMHNTHSYGIYYHIDGYIDKNAHAIVTLSSIISYISRSIKKERSEVASKKLSIKDFKEFDIVSISERDIKIRFSMKDDDTIREVDVPIEHVEKVGATISFPKFTLKTKNDFIDVYISDIQKFRKIMTEIEKYTDILLFKYSKTDRQMNILFPIDDMRTEYINLFVRNLKTGNDDIEDVMDSEYIGINLYYLLDILNMVNVKNVLPIRILNVKGVFVLSIPIDYNARGVIASMKPDELVLNKIYNISYSRIFSPKYILPRLNELLYDRVSDNDGNRTQAKFVEMGILKFTKVILKEIWRNWIKYTYIMDGNYTEVIKIYIEETLKHFGGAVTHDRSIYYRGHELHVVENPLNSKIEQFMDTKGLMSHITQKEPDIPELENIVPKVRTLILTNNKDESLYVYQTHGLSIIIK